MRKGALFGSILAGLATLVGTAPSAPQITSATEQTVVQPLRDNTQAPATTPASPVVQNLQAGATLIPIPVWLTATPRWAWVGRKVNGRFGYYCRRVGSRV